MNTAAIDRAATRHYADLSMRHQAAYDAAEQWEERITQMAEDMLSDLDHPAWSEIDAEALDTLLRNACEHHERRRLRE